ncbi:hypothetical protein ACFCVO_08870 [Agromyces sp. NPDC056379]|uniref:hypothetical protein n=1 Tax=Agromyces sp. NPDC056379 TaxID=3345802 RepID=UPI0035E08839
MGFSEWLAIALFVVGIPVTWFLARRNRQRPDLRYAIDQEELIAPDDSLLNGGLQLKFRGAELTRLTRTYVAVWSKRGDTIRRDDLTAADPLRIRLGPDDSVLSARIVTMSRTQIQANTSVTSPGVAEISFDFLDPTDGFVVEVLHLTNAEAELGGTLKGADIREIKNVDLAPRARERAKLGFIARVRDYYRGPRLAVLFMAAITCLAVVLILLSEFLQWDLRPILGLRPRLESTPVEERVLFRTVVMVATVPVLLLLLYSILTPLRRRIPREILIIDQQATFEWSQGVPHEKFPDGAINVGQTILHDQFGPGVVVRIAGGPNEVIVVEFDDYGTKRLAANIAPIAPGA